MLAAIHAMTQSHGMNTNWQEYLFPQIFLNL
jgi:hypothetical protein